MLETAGIVVDQGLNLQQYVREFIARIRDLLVVKLGLEDNILGTGEQINDMVPFDSETYANSLFD